MTNVSRIWLHLKFLSHLILGYLSNRLFEWFFSLFIFRSIPSIVDSEWSPMPRHSVPAEGSNQRINIQNVHDIRVETTRVPRRSQVLCYGWLFFLVFFFKFFSYLQPPPPPPTLPGRRSALLSSPSVPGEQWSWARVYRWERLDGGGEKGGKGAEKFSDSVRRSARRKIMAARPKRRRGVRITGTGRGWFWGNGTEDVSRRHSESMWAPGNFE